MILFTLYLCVLISETRPFHMPDRLIKYLLQQLCSTEAAGLQEVLHFCAWAHLAITPTWNVTESNWTVPVTVSSFEPESCMLNRARAVFVLMQSWQRALGCFHFKCSKITSSGVISQFQSAVLTEHCVAGFLCKVLPQFRWLWASWVFFFLFFS